MNFPVSSSLKGMLLKGSPLFCGTMGVSLGGWYTNENANSVHNQLLSEGYKYKVTEPNLSSEAVKKEEYDDEYNKIVEIFKFNNGKCVATFFPKTEEINWNSPEEEDEDSLDLLSSTITLPKNEKSMGCILVESNKTSDKNLRVVKSELTFKQGNKGFILWTGFLDKDVSDASDSKSTQHYLIYLEKDVNKWNIKAGYGLNVSVISDTIKIPGDSGNLFEVNKTLNYAGIWEESSSGGKAILEDIYGKSDKFTNAVAISYVLDASRKKWKEAWISGKDVNPQDYLPQVLNISKHKKGYWIDMDNFCWNLSIRNLDLKELCYEKTNN